LPELGTLLQTALTDAGLVDVQAKAEEAGERCKNMQTGEGDFWAMMSTVSTEAPVADLGDLDAVGAVVAAVASAVLPVVTTAPPDVMPGGSPPMIGFTVVSPTGRATLWTSLPKLQSALDQGLTGAALVAELGYKP
jgi:hypothetical protein